MRHKVGDKVKIKTWEEMAKEFGMARVSWEKKPVINSPVRFTRYVEEEIGELKTDRILTIYRTILSKDRHMIKCEYRVKELISTIYEGWIVDEILNPIHSRWELLDL